MIIDSHVHLKHGDAAGTEYHPAQIVESMDEAGVARSVVFAINTTTERSIAMARQAVEQFPERLIPYANVEPSYDPSAVELIAAAIERLGFRGMKIHLGYGVPGLQAVGPFLELAADKDVPCVIDCVGRGDVMQQWAEAFPRTNLIIAHLGRYLCEDEALVDSFIELAATHEHVFLDVSGVVLIHKIKDAVRKAGATKVLFGSDGPYPRPDLAGFVRGEIAKVRAAGLSPEQEAAVLGGNAARLLRL